MTSLENHIIEFNDELRSIPVSFGDDELYDEVKKALVSSISASKNAEFCSLAE